MKYIVDVNNTHHFLPGKAKNFFVDIEEKDPKAWNDLTGAEVSKIIERCLDKMPIVSDDYSDEMIDSIKIFLMAVQRALTYVPMASRVKSYALLDDPFCGRGPVVETNQKVNFTELLKSDDYTTMYKTRVLEFLCDYETVDELREAINSLSKMIELKKKSSDVKAMEKHVSHVFRMAQKQESRLEKFLTHSNNDESKNDYDVFEEGMLSHEGVIGYYKGQAIHDIVNFKNDVDKLLEAKRLMKRLMKFQFGVDA